jgi:hypothetical protein
VLGVVALRRDGSATQQRSAHLGLVLGLAGAALSIVLWATVAHRLATMA